MFRFQLTSQSSQTIRKLSEFLNQVAQLQQTWPGEVAQQFAGLLRSEYEVISPIDIPELAEQFPEWYTGLKDDLGLIAQNIVIIDTQDGRAAVGINPDAKTTSGLPVHWLAYIIEYGLADLGIPAFRCFERATKRLI